MTARIRRNGLLIYIDFFMCCCERFFCCVFLLLFCFVATSANAFTDEREALVNDRTSERPRGLFMDCCGKELNSKKLEQRVEKLEETVAKLSDCERLCVLAESITGLEKKIDKMENDESSWQEKMSEFPARLISLEIRVADAFKELRHWENSVADANVPKLKEDLGAAIGKLKELMLRVLAILEKNVKID